MKKERGRKNCVPNLTVNQVGDSWCPDSLPIEVKLVEVGGTLSEKVANSSFSFSFLLNHHHGEPKTKYIINPTKG